MTKLLGMILVEAGAVTSSQLAEALTYQERNGGFLGEVLMDLGFIDSKTLGLYLDKQKLLLDSH